MRYANLMLTCSVSVLIACSSANETKVEPIASCRDYAENCVRGSLGAITRCETERLTQEPQGCGRESAEVYACMTETCGETDDACGPEKARAAVCDFEFEFEVTMGCNRWLGGDRSCDVAGGWYGFICGTESIAAKRCKPVENADFFGVYCCPAFGETGFFADPELTPDELPPDHSAVDFLDRAQCVSFGAEQGWCDALTACACERCAEPLGECAHDYMCLRSLSCGIDDSLCTREAVFFIDDNYWQKLHETLSSCYSEACAESLSCP